MNTFVELNLTGFCNYLTFFLSFIVGGIVYLKNRDASANKAFFAICLTGGLWLFCMGTVICALSDRVAIHFLLLSYLVAVPYISPSVYNFSLKVTRQKETFPFLKIGLFVAILISGFAFVAVDEVWTLQKRTWGRFSAFESNLAGITFFAIVFLQFIFYATLAFITLVKAYCRTTDPHEKRSLKIFLVGAVIGYTGLIDFFVAWKLPIYPIGYVSFTTFLLIIFYGIIRHRFLDTQLIVKKLTLIFLIYGVLLLLIFPVSKLVNYQLTLEGISYHQSSLIVGLLIGILLSTGPFIYAAVVKNSYWLRGHTTTGLVHELKSPLATIQGALGIVLGDLREPSLNKDKAVEYLTMVQNNAARLEQSIFNLLTIAKDQDDMLEIQRRETNFKLLLQEVASQYQNLAEQKGIEIGISTDDCFIAIDYQRIRQVLSNLLSNAIKFSENGIVRIECTKSTNSLLCCVRDSGKGIPSRSIAKIFDKFYQVDPGQKGTGIGLTIAKTWVEAHGGRIWAESEGEEKGTTVAFTLPL